MSWHNHGIDGEFKGYRIEDLPQRYFMRVIPRLPLYHVVMDEENPLYFIDSRGRKWTTRREYDSDFASIPPPFDRFWSPASLRLSGLLHDDDCKNEGLYQIMDDGSQKFVKMSRKESDLLIKEMAPQEVKLYGRGKCYQKFTEWGIYIGVRIGAFLGIGRPEKGRGCDHIDINWPPIKMA